jgi:hypothetical protein
MLLWYRHLAGESAIFMAPDGIRPRRGESWPDLAALHLSRAVHRSDHRCLLCLP